MVPVVAVALMAAAAAAVALASWIVAAEQGHTLENYTVALSAQGKAVMPSLR